MAQASVCHNALVDELFGNDAYEGDFFREPVRKFIENLMVNTWQRFRKSLFRETKRLNEIRQEVDKLWNGK